MANLKTNNVYRYDDAASMAEGYREMARRIEKYPQDTHYIKPFLPADDTTFEITPEQIPGFCAWLREMAANPNLGD